MLKCSLRKNWKKVPKGNLSLLSLTLKTSESEEMKIDPKDNSNIKNVIKVKIEKIINHEMTNSKALLYKNLEHTNKGNNLKEQESDDKSIQPKMMALDNQKDANTNENDDLQNHQTEQRKNKKQLETQTIISLEVKNYIIFVVTSIFPHNYNADKI